MYGLKVKEVNGEPCIYLDRSSSAYSSSVDDMLRAWMKQSTLLESGEISKEEYDEWRYKYHELDNSPHWAKIPSQAVSDMLLEAFREEENAKKKKAKKKK